ncbi:resolvase Holliday junction-type protein [Marine Group I thaumarchaeote SCGC AAA799-B03]|uniref:Resolvase Holliday junction-type protein n=3 Tax=Marine Group I TaxID=905826 RepID=A0A087S8G9_9ARCH|nr:resolvase Holliday junction-type protein [Marine Group I thaumarchaeote SCGC AAA799-N04]KFM18049.1 resolvase Holliday junction-type protein [Marine Group I thaumarchaeote SCGC RSA3]KFM22023.1 resolvase Holliday junction-type protein [Marine Group I thaumarchaeote SCGC AAA799-B03]
MRSRTLTVSKLSKNTKSNNQKAAKTRRQRGYQWEDTLVKRFNTAPNWKAFRLGSPSIALPDVLAVNTENSTIFTIEAKSGTSTSLPVPFDQIERCLEWIKTFDIYKKRHVLLAFKFLSKKRVGVGKYESRELREFYKIWDETLDITDCVCTYEGKIYAKINGSRKEIYLKECSMPFKTKQRK